MQPGTKVQIWALGPMISEAFRLSEAISSVWDISVGVVNARFAKPLDSALLIDQAEDAELIISMEDGTASGGMGSAICEALQAAGKHTSVEIVGWPDRFVDHGSSVGELRRLGGLDFESIQERVFERLESILPSLKESPSAINA